jgi:Mrp family chromosome partitioning ATPase
VEPVETEEGVHILTAGENGSISGLYGPRMVDLIVKFRRDFDFVLVDTPAMLYISDARALGRLADGVILVVRANSTDRDAAWAVRQRLAEDGIPVLGSILNDWKPTSSGRYDPRQFYKYYRTRT